MPLGKRGWIYCTKVKYDKKGAETALNKILKNLKRFQRRKEQRIYHCPLCNAWHLTKMEDYIEEEMEVNVIENDEFKKYMCG